MPWKECTAMQAKEQFIREAKIGILSFSSLCAKYKISRQTGYKWLNRERLLGPAGLIELSRRPKRSPKQTTAEVEAEILRIRSEHTDWGGRKIRKIIEREGKFTIPAASTITAILRRNGKLDKEQCEKRGAITRYEYEKPNQLWHMDFKGNFLLLDETLCYPLTIIDDHSRFLVGLKACPDEKALTVQKHLSEIFKKYGMPERILIDNGAPWGDDEDSPYTFLTTWMMEMGIAITHCRPYHPQTNGKNERFNLTLQNEVITKQGFENLEEVQARFDEWGEMYNTYRPHDALGLEVPASRYKPSSQRFPEGLPVPDYGSTAIVRRTDQRGKIFFEGHRLRLGKAFPKKKVEIRPTTTEGVIEVYYFNFKIAHFDLRNRKG